MLQYNVGMLCDAKIKLCTESLREVVDIFNEAVTNAFVEFIRQNGQCQLPTHPCPRYVLLLSVPVPVPVPVLLLLTLHARTTTGGKVKEDHIKRHLKLIGIAKICNVLERKYKKSPKEMVMGAFEQFDVNGDGQIEKAELQAILADVKFSYLEQDGAQAALDTMYAKMDSDGDGKISIIEFSHFVIGNQ